MSGSSNEEEFSFTPSDDHGSGVVKTMARDEFERETHPDHQCARDLFGGWLRPATLSYGLSCDEPKSQSKRPKAASDQHEFFVFDRVGGGQ